MNSGIYIYTFASGKEYIGQAIDIQARWDQHTKKMQSGKHTNLIQNEYNRYGLPQFRVLMPCHPCHLDWVEAVYINGLNPALNTVVPKIHMPYGTFNLVETELAKDVPSILAELKEATDNCIETASMLEACEKKKERVHKEVARLKKRVLDVAIEKAPEELTKHLQGLTEQVNSLQARLNSKSTSYTELYSYVELLKKAMAERIDKYNAIPWWKRIFKDV